MALSNCSHQVIWIKQMFEEIRYNLAPIPICGDSQRSLFIAQNPVTKQHFKHIHIKYHFVRDAVMVFKQVELFFIPGIDNPADMFTKNLGHVKFKQYRSQLGLEFHNLSFSHGPYN
jgi:hypothetical protein